MSEALIITITPHQSGARLTWRSNLSQGEGLIFMEDVASIIDQAKQGYIDIAYLPSIDGTTLDSFKTDGSDEVSNA